MTGAISRGQARFAVGLLFGVNFLNYIDRYVIAAVLPLIQQEFRLDDARACATVADGSVDLFCGNVGR